MTSRKTRPTGLACLTALLLLTPAGATSAQSVPESIHSEAQGPTQLCGLTADSVAALRTKAASSETLRVVPIDTPRFELYADADQTYQLIFTRPSEAAYPAATCRHTFDEDGSVRMNRSMRCEGGRAECDALFLEFQALDAQLTSALQGGR